MIERTGREVKEIRNLLRTPTPENIALVNQKLELLASYLTSVKNGLSDGKTCDSKSRKILACLPTELSAIRVLLQGPVEFFRSLNALRAAKFGSYERTGTLRKFELEVRGKTLVHL